MKVGILGFGDGGLCHLKSLTAAGAEVVAVCDRNEEVLKAMQGEVGDEVNFYADVRELLCDNDVELIVVATPDDSHLSPTRAALKAGKRVFVEKPVATSRDDLKQFRELVEEYPQQVLFSEKYSFAHPVQAVLAHRKKLGRFLCGTTLFTTWKSDRIMGDGKWRTEHAYNPCAGGLSHNFMVALLFNESPIKRVRATGQILTYHQNLESFGGYDTMEGTLEFSSGQRINWLVCLAVKGADSLYGHRTVAHLFQFEHGSLAYSPAPQNDQLIIDGQRVVFLAEPEAENWSDYNLGVLYTKMHRDLLTSIATGKPALHDVLQGINVAYACCLAFESAKQGSAWLELPN